MTWTDSNISRHVDNYTSRLSTGAPVNIDDLIPTYVELGSVLHPKPNDHQIDLDALKYSIQRLPDDIFSISKVYLASSLSDFNSIGLDVSKWTSVSSVSRRRLTYINPIKNTLAVFLSSDSDIHDFVNCLLAFYIEKKKLSPAGLSPDNLAAIKSLLGDRWQQKLSLVSGFSQLTIQLLNPNKPSYLENSKKWLDNLTNSSLLIGPERLPIYFVSSNSHSIVNLITGFLDSKQTYIFDYISHRYPDLYDQWFSIKQSGKLDRISDFLYYAANIYLQEKPEFATEKQIFEQNLGIGQIDTGQIFQSRTRIIPLKTIATANNESLNLQFDRQLLSTSDAYIINIEYPLGFAAYYLINSVLSTFPKLQSLYILGKAAILRGSIGDIQLPISVHDELTNNDYHFSNYFNDNSSFQANLSNVLGNQRAVSVYGTFLENPATIESYLKAGINLVEMESGPYLQAICERYLLNGNDISPNCSYTIPSLPFDFGIINYASDIPLVQTLAREGISIHGVEPVYLASSAILRRIIELEERRLSS